MAGRKTGEIDRLVGRALALRRHLLGLTPEGLADRVGLTSEEIHSFETGTKRISASHLHLLASALGVPIAYFYEKVSPSDTEDKLPQKPFLRVIKGNRG